MKLWWTVATPNYVVSDEEDLSAFQKTSVIGSMENEYQEPRYQLVAEGDKFKATLESCKLDLNIKITSHPSGEVLYRRLCDDIEDNTKC